MSLTWASGPGEGWLDALFPSFQWMQVRPRGRQNYDFQIVHTREDLPGDVGTAEVCFREPDGWISCVLRDSIWAQQKRDRGLPEIPQDAPEFVPPFAGDVTRIPEAVVVSSHPSEDLPENAQTVAIEWGTIFQSGLDIANAWGQSQVFQGPQQFVGASIPQSTTPGVAPMTSCGCNSNPCVCGTINGRPALVDPRTGKRCYRRRRRVMLTEGDFNTLLRIATLPNNANVRTALAKAIGRR